MIADRATRQFIACSHSPSHQEHQCNNIPPSTDFASFRYAFTSTTTSTSSSDIIISTLEDLLLRPCASSAGRATLSNWMTHPSIDASTITSRHASIEYLINEPVLSQRLRVLLTNAATSIDEGIYIYN